jgi:Mg2+-importing ATPase
MDKEFYFSKETELFKKLNSSEKGLTSSGAKERIEKVGFNELPEKDKRTVVSIFFSQFNSPLILILIFASIVAGLLKEITNALIILGIVLINALLSFYQEYKSEKALKKLKGYISFRANVLRDGKNIELDTREIVPGDIVFLNIGDIVPADMRLLDSEELLVNEASITGESMPVEKICGVVRENASMTEMRNMVFMGSVVSGGLGKGIVVATGKNTALGKIATVLSSKEPPSDFQKGISNFGGFLLKLIFYLSIFVFAINAFLGKGILSSFLFALALAVGITPELLPVIITISLSSGAIHMAKKKVIVKKLASIEDLGNVDVLCVDKTGTLTENRVSLNDYFDIEGKKQKDIIESALMCNDAIVEEKQVSGNVIDVAIWDYAKRTGVRTERFKKIEEIEFDFSRKLMSVIIEKDRKRFLVSKGEPLSILKACSRIKKKNGTVSIKGYAEKIKFEFEKNSRRGFRVIAVACKEIGTKKDYTAKDEDGMIFLGFVNFFDPVKKSARDSIKRIKALGVEIKVLTGDNEIISEEVCKGVGLVIKNKIVTGGELEKFNETEFKKAVEENNVFARVTPEQKFRIVSELNRNGHIVGFLGDGINDAPALKVSDVGISVDSATDVAKESADVVLLDKSLAVVADGITEGRKTFGNINKYILNTTSANFGNMFTLAAASLYFKFIPLLPAQILLLNFISDVPMTSVSTDRVDDTSLHKPKRWNIQMISRFMIFFGLISTIFDIITIALIWFLLSPNNPEMFRTIWFTESVLTEIIIIFSLRTEKPFWKSKPSKTLILTSVIGVLIALGVIFIPQISSWFEFKNIGFFVAGVLVLLLAGYVATVEIGKKIFYAREKKLMEKK